MSDAKLEWDWQDNNQSHVSSFSSPGALKYAKRTQGALISIFMNKRSTNFLSRAFLCFVAAILNFQFARAVYGNRS